jgi:hypothetical protein
VGVRSRQAPLTKPLGDRGEPKGPGKDLGGRADGKGYVYQVKQHADNVRITATMRPVKGNEISIWICGSPENAKNDGSTLAVSTQAAGVGYLAKRILLRGGNCTVRWSSRCVLIVAPVSSSGARESRLPRGESGVDAISTQAGSLR